MISKDELQKLVSCQTNGKQKIGGINHFKKIDVCVMHAVMAVCFKPFGFSAADVVQKLKKIYGLNLKPTQVSYVLRKLKAKNIILTPKGKRKYYASSNGLQIILGMIITTEQQLPKILACGANDEVIKDPSLKENYRDAYFQLKGSIRNFINY